MDLRHFIYVTFVLLGIVVQVSGTAVCEVQDREDCVYTVLCEFHAGNAYTPDCNYSPYVTFIITKSNVETLYAGFFGSTNFDSRVRVIKGIDNVWPVLDTSVFRYYTRTIIMDLSNNNIETIRDEAFRNLVALESLNLSSNAIEHVNSKTFLCSDSKKSSLHILDLSNNKISVLPSDLFVFASELTELYLQKNNIKSIEDDTFRSLSLLTHLYLQYNKITRLNETITALTSLKVLDLSYNSLTMLSGAELNRLTSLEFVNASFNFIEIVQSNCLRQAFNLQTLDLSHNRIQSIIENVMFVTNNRLEYLNLYQNRITHIQDNAFKNNNLTYLNLEKNNLTGELNNNTLSGLQHIVTLDLSNQSITSLKSHAFSDAVKLTSLNLSRNFINLVENTTFENSWTLTILDLSYNNISEIYFLNGCLHNLSELHLENNKLSVIRKHAFVNQTRLIKLDLSMNIIVTLEAYSLPLISLQYLNISGNPIAGVVESNIFSPAKFIRYLDLFYFNITKLNARSLVDLPVLARLNISHNIIDFIDPDNFRGFDNMYSLDLSYNLLSSFQLNNCTLSNLKALYLNNNRLANISRSLLNMSSLIYLDLSNNFIVELSNVPFSEVPDLKVIHFTNNRISVFNNPQTNSMNKLTELYLSNNDLVSVNLSYFKDLVVVDVSNNKFSSINVSFFENLSSLQVLDMSNTSISKIAPGTFQHVKILKLLNMSYNHLTSLRYGSFRGLHKTEVIDLSHNKLSKVDADVFHECIELKILIIDHNNVSSIDLDQLIDTLPKLKTLSLGGNPMSCQEIVRNIKRFKAPQPNFRQVDITSLDKIYHEDNVHGIKCGDVNYTDLYGQPDDESDQVHASRTVSNVLIGWCSVLTIVVIAFVAIYFYRKTQKPMYSIRESRVPLSNSLDFSLSRSDNVNDLLS